MNANQAREFLLALGVHNPSVRQKWVTGRCPLAPWTHANGKDTNPSFGLTVAPGGNSMFNCFSCMKGGADTLLQTLEFYKGKTPDRGPSMDFKAARQILHDESVSVILPGYKEFDVKDYDVFQEWPGYWLDQFDIVENYPEPVKYLKTRDVLGIPEPQWYEFELRYDVYRRMIICPFRNVYGKFAGARGRSIDAGTAGWMKHYDYGWNNVRNTRLVWYNEQALQLDGPVVVVEGQFDCMRVAERYPKVVANLTAMPTLPKLTRLLQSPSVVLVPDPDATGAKAEKEYHKWAGVAGMQLRVLKLPPEVDPGKCHPDYLWERLAPLVG